MGKHGCGTVSLVREAGVYYVTAELTMSGEHTSWRSHGLATKKEAEDLLSTVMDLLRAGLPVTNVCFRMPS